LKNYRHSNSAINQSKYIDFGHYFSPKSTLRLIRELTDLSIYGKSFEQENMIHNCDTGAQNPTHVGF